jgi:hypothetical protein
VTNVSNEETVNRGAGGSGMGGPAWVLLRSGFSTCLRARPAKMVAMALNVRYRRL